MSITEDPDEPTPSESVSNIPAEVTNANLPPDWIVKHHHARMIERDGAKMYSCNYCTKSYAAAATTSTIAHLRSKHKSKLSPVEQDLAPSQSSLSVMNSFVRGVPSYSDVKFQEELCQAIIVHDLPFSFTDFKAFRNLFTMLRPSVTNALMSRRTLVRRLNSMFEKYLYLNKRSLQENKSKISLTIDAWTSKAMQSFLGVTAHYIDDSWSLKSTILDFKKVIGKHSGKNMAEHLVKILTEYTLSPKLLCITADNASNNNTLMTSLAEELDENEDLVFQPEWQYNRCIAHVVNLVCEDLMKSCKLLSENDLLGAERQAIGLSPLQKIQHQVRAIRNSTQKREKFERLSRKLKMPVVTPTIDVPTRWNSSYDMVEHAFQYRKVFDALCDDLPTIKLSDEDWQEIEELIAILKPFKEVTLLSSAQSYISISSCAYCYQFLLKAFESIAPIGSITSSCIDAARDKLIEYYDKMPVVGNLSIILDPRYNVEFLKKHWDEEWIETAIEQLKGAYAAYELQYPIPPSETRQVEQPMPSTSKKRRLTLHSWESGDSLVDEDSVSIDNEIVRYIALRRQKCDPLVWWKLNEQYYPILSKMARDYLAAQATSAPCERVFSGGADLVTASRSSLSGENIRRTMCLKYWLRAKFGLSSLDNAIDLDADFEEET